MRIKNIFSLLSPAAMLDLSELDLARFKWIGSGNYVGLKQNRSDGHVGLLLDPISWSLAVSHPSF